MIREIVPADEDHSHDAPLAQASCLSVSRRNEANRRRLRVLGTNAQQRRCHPGHE
jgi:hypothetical protein